MPDINATLDERSTTHGDFSQVGAVAQTLKRILRETPNWKALNPAQQEALEMDMAKTARILCGSPNEQDHWFDKAGYATLGARACLLPGTIRFGSEQTVANPPTRLPLSSGPAAENKPPLRGDNSSSPAVPFTLPLKKEEPPKSA